MKLYKYNQYSEKLDNQMDNDGILPSSSNIGHEEKLGDQTGNDGNLPSIAGQENGVVPESKGYETCLSSSDSDSEFNVILTRAHAKKRSTKARNKEKYASFLTQEENKISGNAKNVPESSPKEVSTSAILQKIPERA